MPAIVPTARKAAHTIALVAGLLPVLVPASAQEPAVPADPPPAGSTDVVPEKIEPQRPIGPPAAPEVNTPDEPAPSGFVIRPPPGVDPEMVAPPPDDGAAVGPVIKPPPPPQ